MINDVECITCGRTISWDIDGTCSECGMYLHCDRCGEIIVHCTCEEQNKETVVEKLIPYPVSTGKFVRHHPDCECSRCAPDKNVYFHEEPKLNGWNEVVTVDSIRLITTFWVVYYKVQGKDGVYMMRMDEWNRLRFAE